MWFRSFSSLIALLMVCGLAQARTAHVGSGGGVQIPHVEKPPRNIVLVIIDDIGTENIDVYDAEGVSGPTPQIDALAAEGVRFTNFFAQPICGAFRNSVMNGLYRQSHELQHNPEDPITTNISRVLTKLGYRTEMYGKVQSQVIDSVLTLRPSAVGFLHQEGSYGNLGAEFSDGNGAGLYDDWEKCTNGTCTNETTYASTDTTDDAVAGLAGTEPFFMVVSYNAAHKPYHIPPADLHTYDATCLDVQANKLLCYKAAIESMDTEFGRFMDSVDRDDTTIILVSDNGTPVGVVESPRTTANVKLTVYKWGIEMPFIVAGNVVPPARHGGTSAAYVNSTDLYKTILDLAGSDVVANDRSTAISAIPAILDGSATTRDFMFVEYYLVSDYPPTAADDWLRTIQCSSDHASCNVAYKLIQDLKADTEEFYDKNADDGETSALNTSSLNANQQTAYDALSVLILTEGAQR